MRRSDRPLSRKLIRLGFQLLGRSRAHRQDIWPGLHLDRTDGRALWRGRPLLELHSFDSLIPHNAPLIAVVGSGPSLKGQRVEVLGDDTAILCNGAASLSDRIHPLAVAVEDERFVFRHHAMLANLARDIPLMLSPAAIRAWAERDATTLAGRRVALIDNLAKPVNAARRALDDPSLDGFLLRDRDAALSLDPERGVIITGTVAFSAMQIALAARPARIGLAGIDLSNAAQPRFYETAGRSAPSGIVTGLNRILASFALARKHARQQGIAVFCHSPDSALLDLDYPFDPMLDRASSAPQEP